MKNIIIYLTVPLLLTAVLIAGVYQRCAVAQELSDPHIEILTPGMIRTLTIEGDGSAEDIRNFLVMVVGWGGVEINLWMPPDQQGIFVGFAGVGISTAGIVPLLRFGESDVILRDVVEIGTPQAPFGLLWITAWVVSSENNPFFAYYLTLSF
jgi:hypothetical protein